ncbi:hypothetical protein BHM03_00008317 [Ensete ventricosum]|nr:hypothetical protein BHM03_00008317 [Ensete ventricosum]
MGAKVVGSAVGSNLNEVWVRKRGGWLTVSKNLGKCIVRLVWSYLMIALAVGGREAHLLRNPIWVSSAAPENSLSDPFVFFFFPLSEIYESRGLCCQRIQDEDPQGTFFPASVASLMPSEGKRLFPFLGWKRPPRSGSG